MVEIEIKKSKFFGYIFKLENFDEAKVILEKIKKEHKKATHFCYALRISKYEFLEKTFDDGEPSGTAGKPILNVLQKRNIENAIIVVARLFGGIKLGTGGLLRAYSKCASQVVKSESFDKI